MKMTPPVIGIALLLGAGVAFAHDDAQRKKAPFSSAQLAETPFGKAGDAKKFADHARVVRHGPEGARDCSHGWSEAEPVVRAPRRIIESKSGALASD